MNRRGTREHSGVSQYFPPALSSRISCSDRNILHPHCPHAVRPLGTGNVNSVAKEPNFWVDYLLLC